MSDRGSFLLRSALLLATVCAAAACSSTGDVDEEFVGPPTQVRWLTFKTGQVIALVNDSHTNRLELYSELRTEAGPKVTTDEVMDSLVEYFLEDQDFGKYAQQGPAPVAATAGATQALELSVGERVSHMRLGPSTSPKERETFNACAEALTTIWNYTYQVQAVENPEGDAIFEKPSQGAQPRNR